MLVFALTEQAPPVLILALLIFCYLAGYELWQEKDLPFLWKAWWVLFVFLLHIVGYAIFWIWLRVRRSRRRAEG
jgi:hypothetical protein